MHHDQLNASNLSRGASGTLAASAACATCLITWSLLAVSGDAEFSAKNSGSFGNGSRPKACRKALNLCWMTFIIEQRTHSLRIEQSRSIVRRAGVLIILWL